MRMTSLLILSVVACTGGGNPKPQTPTPKPDPVADKVQTPAKVATTFHVELVAAQPGAALEGTVRDAHTKEALAGVTIVVTSPVLQGTQTAITDENGRFEMPGLPPGKGYQLTAYYNDLTTAGNFTVETGKNARVAIDWDIQAGATDIIKISPDAPPEPKFTTAEEALKHGALAQAVDLGTKELAKAPSSKLHAIVALAAYGDAFERLRFEAFLGSRDRPRTGKDLKQAMANLLASLDNTQTHLAEAAKDAKFSFELCVACIATEDGFLQSFPPGSFDVERDNQGKELDPDDKRRRPTYRFDHGDLTWAQAMVSFQQALVNVTLAYDWDWLDALMKDDDDDDAKRPTKFTIKLVEPARVAKAKDLILAGLVASDACRAEFLAETDDDREWVPNPKQKNYTSPLSVDDKLYTKWAEIVGDVRSLVSGQNGLSIKSLWSIVGQKDAAPAGFLDPGAMLATPKDIVFDTAAIDAADHEKNVAKRNAQIVAILKNVVGNGYKATMKPSRITDRLVQLRKDTAGSEDALEDKLKYIFWLN